MDHPTPPWRIVSPEEAADTIERHRRFQEHQRVLEAEWPMLLNNYPHQWVAVYGGGTIVVRPDMQTIRDAVPEDELGSAAMRYITRVDHPRIL